MVGLIEDTQIIPINSRVKVYSDYGTVKYNGTIEGYEGEWVGIEWDDPGRGKHNGTINGKVYFKTSHPTSGSMIRPGKILQPETLAQAIEARYMMDCENPLDESLIKEAQKYLNASLFEIVGMEKIIDKQSRLEDFVDISVANSNINRAGNLNSLHNLVSIDLTSTLIWNWNIVSDIVKQLPSLRFLNLAGNKLQKPAENEISELEPYFRHVKNLSLRQCGMSSWDDILHIARLWPNIESLGLQDNGIAKITVPDCDVVFRKLEYIDLHMNKLSDFNQIIKLGSIKTLTTLLLMENEIENVQLPDCEYNEYLKIFINLETLHLKDNPIVDEIYSFNELDKLPKLSNLTFTSNKKTGFEEMFSRGVAMIGNLKVLNKVAITNEQRRGAEYDIWKMFGWDWIKTLNIPAEHLKLKRKCRTYHKLINKYGTPEESMVCPIIKKSNLISINIRDLKNDIVIKKKVPLRMSIQTLQGLILKLFKTDELYLPKISYVDSKYSDIRVKMDNLSKNLDYYSIQDGDTVVFD